MKYSGISATVFLALGLLFSGCASSAGRAVPPVPRCRVADEDSGGFLSGKNMLVGFMLIGPFAVTGGGGDLPMESLHFPHLADERHFNGKEPLPETVRTVAVPEDSESLSCNLKTFFPEDKVIYAIVCIESRQERQELTLHTGSSGYIKVWWNGVLVQTYDKTPRTGALDQDAVEHLSMKKGDNLLLIKCVRTGDQWDLFCRFSQNGRPLMLFPVKPAAAQ